MDATVIPGIKKCEVNFNYTWHFKVQKLSDSPVN